VHQMVLTDRFGRPLLNLRVSVANECNYRCIFCHLEGAPLKGPLPLSKLLSSKYLRPVDYAVIAEAASRLGIEKIKITGGEPLVRPDIVDIVEAFREHGDFADISMTTNGFKLAEYAVKLKEAGLDRVNISIHSLESERYRYITGVSGLEHAMRALDASLEAGFRAVKVNVVVMRGINEDEIPRFIDLAARKGFILQLIELHPVGLGRNIFDNHFISLHRIEKYLKERAVEIRIRKELHNRPIYVLENGVQVEVVRPYGNWMFCMGCTRIRISPEGYLYPCINWRGPRINLSRRLEKVEGWEEKVSTVMDAIVEVNNMREPYFKPPSRLPPPRLPAIEPGRREYASYDS